MNIGRSLRNLFHLPGRRSQNRPEGSDTTRGGQPPPAAPGNAPETRTAPVPIPGGRRPTDPPLPLPPHLQARTATPPPSYHSHGGASQLFGSTPPLPNSPAPSFAVNPRPDERRLGLSDFGDRLGMAPSDAGSVSSLGLDGGSLHVHRPASETGSRATDAGAPSITSSLDAQASHHGHAEPEVTENPTPRFAAFLDRSRQNGHGSRFREDFRD